MFFRENERIDLSNGEILREKNNNNKKKNKKIKKKKKKRISKTPFPIFKSVNDVESEALQNNQLESHENQNYCEIDTQKTAAHL